nr:hypothetical protein [Pseudoclavibacter helvolus]
MRLLLPGFQASPADWYAAADVYLLTSRQDPGPTTVVDAACVGVPFVGLETDIGLRDLTEVVDRTGEFVPDEPTLARRAIEVAGSETAQSQLATVGRLQGPRLRQFLLRGFSLPGRVRLRLRARRALRSAPTVRRERLASVAVVQGEVILDAEALRSDEDAAQLVHQGDRGWLAETRLLSDVGSDLDLRIVRQAGMSTWPLLRDVERAGDRIQRITQYDAARAPRWVRARSRPRRAIAAGLPPRDAVWFAPAAPVLLPRPVGGVRARVLPRHRRGSRAAAGDARSSDAGLRLDRH